MDVMAELAGLLERTDTEAVSDDGMERVRDLYERALDLEDELDGPDGDRARTELVHVAAGIRRILEPARA